MKIPAFIQVDIDGAWAVRRCYGMPEEPYVENDPVYEQGIPRFLELFRKYGIPASFFVVGRDARIPQKQNRLYEILTQGHEIGNHSDNHTLGLTRLSSREIKLDIQNAQDSISKALLNKGFSKKQMPVGFRSPGYDTDQHLLRVVSELGFQYDATLFPSYWGFAMRGIDSYISGRLFGGKRQYGTFRNGMRSLSPHRIKGLENLLILPVTVSQKLRLPFHFGIVMKLGFSYFRRCIDSYLKKRIPVLYLFHGIDLVDTKDMQLLPSSRGAGFFKTDIKERIKTAEKVLSYIAEYFTITRARDFAASLPFCQNPYQN